MDEKTQAEENILRDQKLTEIILRLYSLEELLITKQILTKEEMAESLMQATKKLIDIVNEALRTDSKG